MTPTAHIAQCNADIERLAPAAFAAADAHARAAGWNGHVIGSPCPAGVRLYGLARQLARATARGHTTAGHSAAALLNAVGGARRDDTLGSYHAPDIFRGTMAAFNAALRRETEARAVAAHHICGALAPLIAQRRPRNVLLAEAHNSNGRDGFPLAEPEVEEIAATEVWYALPAPQGRHHGR